MNLKALYNLSYGLYVISSRKGDRFNAQIANTVVQVTSEPPTIAVCINKQNLTHEFIMSSKVFAAMVLDENVSMVFLGPFGFRSGRDVTKFEKAAFKEEARRREVYHQVDKRWDEIHLGLLREEWEQSTW